MFTKNIFCKYGKHFIFLSYQRMKNVKENMKPTCHKLLGKRQNILASKNTSTKENQRTSSYWKECHLWALLKEQNSALTC